MLNDSYRLNLKTMECEEIKTSGDIPSGRMKHAATLISDNQMFICGGNCSSGGTGTSYILDLYTFEWNRLPIQNEFAVFAQSIFYIPKTNCIWIFGGAEGSNCSNRLSVLNLSKSKLQWEYIDAQEYIYPRFFHASWYLPHEDELYIWAGKGSIREHIRYNDMHMIKLHDYIPVHFDTTSDILQTLYDNDMCDLKIECSDNSYILCHEFIMRARCPYILSDSSSIEINMPSSAVASFILYIYTKELSIIYQTRDLENILALSHELDITQLNILCIRELFKYKRLVLPWQLRKIPIILDIGEASVPQRFERGKLCEYINTVFPKNNFEDLYSKKYFNIELRSNVDNGLVPVHLLFLTARYPYFKSTWDRDTFVFDFPTPVLNYIVKYAYYGDSIFDNINDTDIEILKYIIKVDVFGYFGATSEFLPIFLHKFMKTTF